MNQKNNPAFEPVDSSSHSKRSKNKQLGLNYNLYTQNTYYRTGNILALIEAIITLLAAIIILFAWVVPEFKASQNVEGMREVETYIIVLLVLAIIFFILSI